VAGYVGSWTQDGVRLIGYWIGREHWGRGVATRALDTFLDIVSARPLFAHLANRNVGSMRVLEKCGFVEHMEAARAGPDAGLERVFVLR
jgi:RimJ/RimL family protein N-acetyltransferase